MQERQHKMNMESMGIQHGYNEASADAADRRTRALYNDFSSPSAMVRQLEEAGLSPALMYGMNGASGANVPNGAQGQGVGLGQVSGATGNIFSGSEVGLILSQARLNEAKAKEAEAGAKKLGEEAETEGKTREWKIGVLEEQINLMKEQTNTEKTKQDLNKAEQLFKEADAAMTNLHYDQESESWGYRLEYIQGLVDRQCEEIRELVYRNDFKKESWDDLREQLKLENKQLIANISKTVSETELTKEQLKKVQAEVEKTWREATTEKWKGINEKEVYERWREGLKNSKEIAEIYTDGNVRAAVIGGITRAISTGAMGFIFKK